MRRRAIAVGGLLLVFVAAGTVAAASRYSPWRLGVVETLNTYVTGISGANSSTVLRITNTSTGPSARAIMAFNRSPGSGTGAIYARNSGGGPAANFVVNTGKAPFTVSAGSAKVANLDADKLDGMDANQLVRTSGTSSLAITNDFDTCTFTTVLSKPTTAPVAGVLLISGTTSWEFDFSSAADTRSVLYSRLLLNATQAGTSVGSTTNLTLYEAANSVTAAIAVPAGSHTVHLQAAECETGMAFIYQNSLTTSFVPFGNSGAAGTLATSGSAAPAKLAPGPHPANRP